MKHAKDNRASVLATTMGLLRALENVMNFGPQTV